MGKRILVADDSVTIQRAFAMVMEGSGYSLSFAKSVDEAMAQAKSNGRPDLILSDVGLGAGSGYDLCAEIKGEASLSDVPVYILASAQTPYDESRGRKVGADGYLAKPFESQALLDAVASALATPTKAPTSALPQFSADVGDNTARIASGDLPLEDDDSYGEITIERGSAPSSAPSNWTNKPPTRPSGARPLPAAPAIAVPAAPVPRPSLIPGARPSASVPVARTGTTPQPTSSTPPPGAPRPALNRTMMGFPSVKPPVASKPAPAPVVPLQSRPTPATPVAAVPSRPVLTPASPSPPAPVPVKTSLPPPPVSAPMPPTTTRPVVSRFSPPPASAPNVPAPFSVARKAPTPVPTTASVPGASSPNLSAAVTSAIDQKMAAVAARGPEYEAIAKLSREIIEQVVWEVVPELAEAIIRQEVDRLASAKK
jgi:CheY-like chemotaxis protein